MKKQIFGVKAFACSDFQMIAADGGVVIGRTMDFPIDFSFDISTYPKGTAFTSHSYGKEGLSWTSKYSFVGICMLENAVDGLNEKGLSVENLWLDETQYPQIPKADLAKSIDVVELSKWLLGNFATVDEVKEGLLHAVIGGEGSYVPEWKKHVPLHFAVHDALGKNLVIEFLKGETKIYDNPIGVLTNDPSFEWQMTNLRNYVGFTSFQEEDITINGVNISAMGLGNGLLGLPGDFTAVSRFVRLVFLKYFAELPPSSEEAAILAEHILHAVDTPYGVVKTQVQQKQEVIFTRWFVIKDLKNQVIYLGTYKSNGLRAIDLKKLSFEKEKRLSFTEERKISEITF